MEAPGVFLKGREDATRTGAPWERGRRQLHTAQAMERSRGRKQPLCATGERGAGSLSPRTLCSAQSPALPPVSGSPALEWGVALCLALWYQGIQQWTP